MKTDFNIKYLIFSHENVKDFFFILIRIHFRTTLPIFYQYLMFTSFKHVLINSKIMLDLIQLNTTFQDTTVLIAFIISRYTCKLPMIKQFSICEQQMQIYVIRFNPSLMTG